MLNTIVTTLNDRGEQTVISFLFEIPYNAFDLIGAIKATVAEFCASDAGIQYLATTGNFEARTFNWGDFAACITDSMCRTHGFKLLDVRVEPVKAIFSVDDLIADAS